MCPHPKTWHFIGKPPYQLLTVAQECSTQAEVFFSFNFLLLPNNGVKLPFLGAFFPKIKILLLVNKTGKIITVNFSVKLKKLGLLRTVRTSSSEPDCLPKGFKPVRCHIHTVSFNGNQISPLLGFSARAPLSQWELMRDGGEI